MFNFNPEFAARIPKTKGERLECLPGIRFLSSVIEQSNRQGLLCIDDTLDELKAASAGPWKNPSVNFSARVILRGVVDGQPIDQIERSAEALFCAAGFDGADLLDLILVIEAARTLLGQNSLWVFRDRCNAWTLGDIEKEIGVDSKIDDADMNAEIEAFLTAKRVNEPKRTEIDDLLARLDNRAIQKVLREI
ncbi:MAG: hypothetical protein JNM63_14770, partial [Spirochaetia bacterium]|nr:hypothetical protein [Spirochaetia bacterium]